MKTVLKSSLQGATFVEVEGKKYVNLLSLEPASNDDSGTKGFELIKYSASADVYSKLPADASAYPLACDLHCTIRSGSRNKMTMFVDDIVIQQPAKQPAKAS